MPVVLGVAFGVSFLVPATPAAAHNQLTGSNPRDGARVASAPARVELRFLAKPSPTTTKITITGPDNVVAGGTPAFDGSRVRVPFKPAAAGLYIVGYQLASSDGHPVKGEVRFTLTTGTAADPSASPSAAASTNPAGSPSAAASAVGVPSAGPASATPGGSTASTVPAASERSDSGGRWWIWALGGLLLLAALGAGLVFRRQRRAR
ncbi:MULTISPECIES: copper resistance CopC family protein [Micromonospora]|uniref:copper resistance CopC family protein n=1 Tax=Micromonospora TaxID=1873 RepID=UPI001EE89733|nr:MULTISPECIES: copper resistance CopC family protein [Micromonospora]MCG5453003.1 copper resistance protein CopC [Micromonospora hortensis]MCX5121146.1 copper resistance protein CopC [Micromonospora sp. NBC_00362]WTI06864.1 copper resistance protein CopC [Micromonospora sp. NBC_00821]